MVVVLVATGAGCRAFTPDREREIELAGRTVTALAGRPDGTCLAVIAEHEIWARRDDGAWSPVTSTAVPLEAITEIGSTIFGGSSDGAVLVCITPEGEERVVGFDRVPGREEWFAHGPPLGVRALTATADGSALLAAVHVGGIPRSTDGGLTWRPTLPIGYDVHEVCAHPSVPILAAATAVGLCVSLTGGESWDVLDEGLDITNSLAVAVLDEEVLFSIQDGPFAERSQVRRWQIGGRELERVGSGLPERLDGKIDTAQIAAGAGRAAVMDGGGNLWLSAAGSRGWHRLARDVRHGQAVLILE